MKGSPSCTAFVWEAAAAAAAAASLLLTELRLPWSSFGSAQGFFPPRAWLFLV